jgi:hypothetical protein
VAMDIRNGLNLGGLVPEHVAREALDEAAHHVLQVAQGKAPILVDVQRANRQEHPGTLRASGYVDVIDDVTAHVGFSDFIAARQHEDLSLHHDDGEAKFLEQPMTSERDEVLRILAERIRAGM